MLGWESAVPVYCSGCWNFSCLRTWAVAEHGWQEPELNPLPLCNRMVRFPLGRASLVSAPPSIPTFTSPPWDCCFLNSAQLCSSSPLPLAAGRERVLELCSWKGPGLHRQELAHGHFHCCKTALRSGLVTVHTSLRAGVSGASQ